MIIFTIYFLLLCFLIFKTNLFGLLKDDVLTPRFYLTAFLIKCSGIAAFYVVYYVFYGSTDYADTYNFMHDSEVIHDIAFWDFSEFLKVMFGLQDESETSELYKRFLVNTNIWHKNPDEFLYNDNRIAVRIHALVHFISFKSYFIHSLFGVLLSFIGIQWIYKSFRHIFRGKEVLLFLCWVLFPGTYFWTSGVLKEAPALFFMGLLILSLKKLIVDRNFNFKILLGAALGISMSFLFKQYLMVPLLFLSATFFVVVSVTQKNTGLKYIISLLVLFMGANTFLKVASGKSALAVMAKRQYTFFDMSKGGIFLTDSVKFLRLPYNFDLIRLDSSEKELKATIKKNVSYIYSEFSHQHDTLLCAANADTLTRFKFEYSIEPAKQTINIPHLNGTYKVFLKTLPFAIYYTLFKPLFFDARNMLDILASIENAILILCLGVLLFFGFRLKENRKWCVYFLSIAFSILIMIGLTSPNPGAIVRYRSLAVPFLVMSAVLVLPVHENSAVFKFFKRNSAE